MSVSTKDDGGKNHEDKAKSHFPKFHVIMDQPWISVSFTVSSQWNARSMQHAFFHERLTVQIYYWLYQKYDFISFCVGRIMQRLMHYEQKYRNSYRPDGRCQTSQTRKLQHTFHTKFRRCTHTFPSTFTINRLIAQQSQNKILSASNTKDCSHSMETSDKVQPSNPWITLVAKHWLKSTFCYCKPRLNGQF